MLCKGTCLDDFTHILLITNIWVDQLKCSQNRLSSSDKVFHFCYSCRSFSSNGSPTGCFRIFASSLEKKNEETWHGVRNSELENRLSPCASLTRRISLATISGSILRPVSCPMLNLETKRDFCFSLKRYGLFTYFNAQPSFNPSVVLVVLTEMIVKAGIRTESLQNSSCILFFAPVKHRSSFRGFCAFLE